MGHAANSRVLTATLIVVLGAAACGEAASPEQPGGSAEAGAPSRDANMALDSSLTPDSDTIRDAGAMADARDAGGNADCPSGFCGVNWADPRDNFVNGLLQPSGVSSSDSYAIVKATAESILSGFQTKLGANAIRIPINEPTVSGTWWHA